MQKGNILVVGSGHLARRVILLLEKGDYSVEHIESILMGSDSKYSTIEIVSKAIQSIDMTSIKMVYLLDDKDEVNLQLILAFISFQKNLKITASFFNENIAPHLQARHPNINIVNPAKLASKAFVDAIYEPVQRTIGYTPIPTQNETISQKRTLVRTLLVIFGMLSLFSVWYFHTIENMTWINAIYFVTTTICTVGYGDINLINSSVQSKIVIIVLMCSSLVFTFFIFSLIMENINKRKAERTLGRKKYKIKDHVIVCGLGRLGYFIAEELLRQGEKVLLVEENERLESLDHFRNQGAYVYIGNARLPRVLDNVNVRNSKALISVINNDSINIEIGMNARSLQSNVRLILRIFDDSMASIVRDNLDIHLTLSMSAVADNEFYRLVNA